MKSLYTQEQFNSTKTFEKLPCECYECKKTFYALKHNIQKVLKESKIVKLKFCSSKCKSKSQTKTKKLNCAHCNKEIYKTQSEIKRAKTNVFCCSYSCASIYKNTHKTTGYNRSKLEKWLESKLIFLYPDQIILFNDVTTIKSELDIYFPNLKLAFELNGTFHYEPIFGKEQLNKVQNNDNRKFQACLEQGIELCVIDSSQQKYFKESTSKKYLDIILMIISKNKCRASRI